MPLKPLKVPGFGEKHDFFFDDKEASQMSKGRRPSTVSIQHGMYWTTKRIGLVVIVAFLTVGAAIGTGVGLVLHKVNRKAVNNSAGIHGSTGSVWQPKAGMTWNMQFVNPLNLNTASAYDVWDIDLFDTNQTTINALHAAGAKVLCYFSGGSYENWRPDANQFLPSDLGKNLAGWPGEKWLNVSSPNVHTIMQARLDLAVSKGCDGVDPDNMDGYNNKNGLGLTQQNAIDYVTFLSTNAKQRGLAISLKNAGEIVPSVVGLVDFSVNESCAEYSECNIWQSFIQQGKPVFHVEYPKGSSTNNYNNVPTNQANKVCDAGGSSGFSSIIKNQNLDDFIQNC